MDLFHILTSYVTDCISFYQWAHMHSPNEWYTNNSIFSRASFLTKEVQIIFKVSRFKDMTNDVTRTWQSPSIWNSFNVRIYKENRSFAMIYIPRLFR